MERSTSEARARKLAGVGVPPERIETAGEHLRIDLSPEQADRFCTVLAVLEESSAVKRMFQTVWS